MTEEEPALTARMDLVIFCCAVGGALIVFVCIGRWLFWNGHFLFYFLFPVCFAVLFWWALVSDVGDVKRFIMTYDGAGGIT